MDDKPINGLKLQKAKTAQQPHTCPNCNGEGTKKNPNISEASPSYTIICNSCNGSGVVWS